VFSDCSERAVERQQEDKFVFVRRGPYSPDFILTEAKYTRNNEW